jgi:hypothetical protein
MLHTAMKKNTGIAYRETESNDGNRLACQLRANSVRWNPLWESSTF